MTKAINITNKSLEQIQALIDQNPTWEVVTCGSSVYSERHESTSVRGGKVMFCDPPKGHYFAIFKSSEYSSEFKEKI